jgi:hypothetical protein
MLFEESNCVRYFEQKIDLGRGSVNGSDEVRFRCGSGHPDGGVAVLSRTLNSVRGALSVLRPNRLGSGTAREVHRGRTCGERSSSPGAGLRRR